MQSLWPKDISLPKGKKSAVSKALFEDSEILQIDKLEPLSEDFKKCHYLVLIKKTGQ